MRVAGCSAVARRAVVEDIGGACLGQEEREKDEAGTREPHEFPHGPLPAFVFGGETANERPKSGATDGGNASNGDTVDLFLRGVHVCDGGAAGGEDGAADEAGEEAEC